MSRYHAQVYRDCPRCGARYIALEAAGTDRAEAPCGCAFRRVPTAAERRAAE